MEFYKFSTKMKHLSSEKVDKGPCKTMHKLKVTGDRMGSASADRHSHFWVHQMMNIVHKNDIQGAHLRFILLLMRGKCSGCESKCAPST